MVIYWRAWDPSGTLYGRVSRPLTAFTVHLRANNDGPGPNMVPTWDPAVRLAQANGSATQTFMPGECQLHGDTLGAVPVGPHRCCERSAYIHFACMHTIRPVSWPVR